MTSHQSTSTQRLEAAIRAVLPSLHIPIQAAYLHGSWGTEFERAESDIDLALLSQTPINLNQQMRIAQALRLQMGISTEIDLADLRNTDTVFAAHVIDEGHRLLVADRSATEQFEMLALAKYARLNEERAGILADIKARGTIYKDGYKHGLPA